MIHVVLNKAGTHNKLYDLLPCLNPCISSGSCYEVIITLKNRTGITFQNVNTQSHGFVGVSVAFTSFQSCKNRAVFDIIFIV